MNKIGFGGGCHWCTEAVFQSLIGVDKVEQGWIASQPPFDAYSEAVLVHFNRAEIDLRVLLEVHLRTHASQHEHRLRSKYRSAAYVFDDAQAAEAREALTRLQGEFDAPIVTRILPFESFRESAPRFQNYYRDNPDRPFCRNYIDPKLALLRRRFGRHAKPVESVSDQPFNERGTTNDEL